MCPIRKLNFQCGRSERVGDRMRQFRSRAYRKREFELNGTRVPACESIVLRVTQTTSLRTTQTTSMRYVALIRWRSLNIATPNMTTNSTLSANVLEGNQVQVKDTVRRPNLPQNALPVVAAPGQTRLEVERGHLNRCRLLPVPRDRLEEHLPSRSRSGDKAIVETQ